MPNGEIWKKVADKEMMEAMLEGGFSQKETAALFKTHQSTISRICSGKRRVRRSGG